MARPAHDSSPSESYPWRTRTRSSTRGPASWCGSRTRATMMPGPAWAEEFHAQILRAALDQIRPSFEPATWRAFERVWIDSRPAAEVAIELGVPIDAVYVAKSRALKRLHAAIVELAEDLPLAV